jgi:hypothetical protein
LASSLFAHQRQIYLPLDNPVASFRFLTLTTLWNQLISYHDNQIVSNKNGILSNLRKLDTEYSDPNILSACLRR